MKAVYVSVLDEKRIFVLKTRPVAAVRCPERRVRRALFRTVRDRITKNKNNGAVANGYFDDEGRGTRRLFGNDSSRPFSLYDIFGIFPRFPAPYNPFFPS